VDASVGYRLPKRYGKVELVVKNLLDETAEYYEIYDPTELILSPRFVPERQIFASFTLDF
jgi:outer membrane receptor protein involved in Fe transport